MYYWAKTISPMNINNLTEEGYCFQVTSPLVLRTFLCYWKDFECHYRVLQVKHVIKESDFSTSINNSIGITVRVLQTGKPITTGRTRTRQFCFQKINVNYSSQIIFTDAAKFLLI